MASIATPGKMMIMTPAGYHFGDYWKPGLPVLAWWFASALLVLPLVWQL